MTAGLSVVGRETELSAIEGFLAGDAHERRVLLLEGEAGIGKTTLLTAGRAQAVELGHAVLSASPIESETPLDFAALADLLEGVDSGRRLMLPAPQQRAVAIALLEAEAGETPPDPRAIVFALLAILRDLSIERPVLVAIDDMPWLDASSQRVLSFALRRLASESVRVLAAVRTERPGEMPPLATDGVLSPRVEHLLVGPLPPAAVGELVAARSTLTLDRRLVTHLHETSGGNPFFALELAAALTTTTPSPGEPLNVPASLRRLVGRRLAGLPERARSVLLAAALESSPSLSVVLAAAPDPATARADLEEGAAAGILRLTGDRLGFVHPLVRAVVVEEAGPGARRATHRRLADAVATPEQRARHLALATTGPSAEVAAELETVARGADLRGACDTAAELAELSATLTPPADFEASQRRTMQAAGYLFEASRMPQAVALVEQVMARSGPGDERATALVLLAKCRRYADEPIRAWRPLLEQALDQAADPSLRANIHLHLAFASANVGDAPAALTGALDSIELADQCGDRALVAQGRAGLAFVLFVLGEGIRQDLIDESLSTPQPDHVVLELRPTYSFAQILRLADDLEGARDLFEAEYARLLDHGEESALPVLLWGLAETEAKAGRWDRAEQLADVGYQAAESTDSLGPLAYVASVTALMHALRGRVDSARAEATRAIELAQRLGWQGPMIAGTHALALVDLSLGDFAGVHRHLAPMAGGLDLAHLPEPNVLRFLPDEIEALIRLGELAAASVLLEAFESRATRPWATATAARCRGLLLAAQGDLTAGVETLESALETHLQLAVPFERARSLLVAGEVHRRARHKRHARLRLEEAVAVFEQLGAPRWAERAGSERTRVGLRPTPDRDDRAGGGLTTAERQVAELATRGRTNQEVASELFMARRTVEAHLSRVYRKLGVRSRTELTRALGQLAEDLPGDGRAP